MNRATTHPLIERYLRDLERAAEGLPPRERRELVAEIRAHFEEGVVTLEGAASEGSDAAIRNLLDDLGAPEAIVAAAGPVAPTRGAGVLEILAVIFLLIGGIVLPVVGWFVGLALLWASAAWTVRHKLLGTLVFPGGLALPLLLGLTASDVVLPQWIGFPMLAVLLVAPLIVAPILLSSARRPAR